MSQSGQVGYPDMPSQALALAHSANHRLGRRCTFAAAMCVL